MGIRDYSGCRSPAGFPCGCGLMVNTTGLCPYLPYLKHLRPTTGNSKMLRRKSLNKYPSVTRKSWRIIPAVYNHTSSQKGTRVSSARCAKILKHGQPEAATAASGRWSNSSLTASQTSWQRLVLVRISHDFTSRNMIYLDLCHSLLIDKMVLCG